MKLSGKDILLVFGIIIAIVVTLTTVAFSEQNSTYLPKLEAPASKASLTQTAAEVLKKSMLQVFEAPRPRQ